MIRHLLEHPPVAAPVQLRKHEIAKRIILLTLPQAQIQGADPKYRHEGMMKSSVTQEVVSSNQGKGTRGFFSDTFEVSRESQRLGSGGGGFRDARKARSTQWSD